MTLVLFSRRLSSSPGFCYMTSSIFESRRYISAVESHLKVSLQIILSPSHERRVERALQHLPRAARVSWGWDNIPLFTARVLRHGRVPPTIIANLFLFPSSDFNFRRAHLSS